MRVTGPKVAQALACVLVAQALACEAKAAEETPFTAIAGLATALSESDPDSAMAYFDAQIKEHATIEANIEALAAQTDVTCAIDVVSDEESNGAHKLDLDWFMDLKSQSDDQRKEQRRQRVSVEMRQIKGKWKITAMSPLSILDPIHIN
jgi:hypothetical protein